jgi:hypothetical protein
MFFTIVQFGFWQVKQWKASSVVYGKRYLTVTYPQSLTNSSLSKSKKIEKRVKMGLNVCSA